MPKDVFLAIMPEASNSQDCLVKYVAPVFNSSNKEQFYTESLTPPELAKQYEREFVEYLGATNMEPEIALRAVKEQTFFKIATKRNKTFDEDKTKIASILQEHSYCKK